MTDPQPTHLIASFRKLMSRRGLIISTAAATVTVALGRSVSGHGGDDHDDDDDDNSGSGSGGDDDRDNDDRDDDRDDDDEIQPSGTVPPDSTEVRIDDDDEDGFEPGTITIDMGQSVTWVNVDDDPHTATGADFDTGRIEPGEQATVVFNEPGVFPYSCQIHPIMTGTVEVRDESGQVPASTAASPQASPDASPQATPQAGAGSTVEVTIQNFAFDPAQVEVSAGTIVRWTNRDTAPHTATSTSDEFDSGTLDSGATFEHTFAEAGTFEYVCAFHPDMQASVVVTG